MRCRGFPAWERPSARLENSTGAAPKAIHCIGQYKASILAIAKKNTLFVRQRGMSGSSGTITFQYREAKTEKWRPVSSITCSRLTLRAFAQASSAHYRHYYGLC